MKKIADTPSLPGICDNFVTTILLGIWVNTNPLAHNTGPDVAVAAWLDVKDNKGTFDSKLRIM